MDGVEDRQHAFAQVLYVLGYIVIGLGVVSGIIVGTDDNLQFAFGDAITLGLAMATVFNSLVLGAILLGISKAIQLSYTNYLLLNSNQTEGEDTESVHTKQIPKPVKQVPRSSQAFEQAKEFFDKKKESIEKMESTEEEDIYLVTLTSKDEPYKIDLSGFKPEIL
ncbi:hypothetical protein QGM71_06790 [Virgibacillus sp. C22-A2]|uniref:Uncharacterized protein n=1 Tax=Virgibacillus tibetensis TaxID=3042313 RepID=A0ABU6KCZ2_9BACI|nr:hypothetical protein [Virgibacillus sp. C22-A2]